jgi:excisionase family DNA binding protein
MKSLKANSPLPPTLRTPANSGQPVTENHLNIVDNTSAGLSNPRAEVPNPVLRNHDLITYRQHGSKPTRKVIPFSKSTQNLAPYLDSRPMDPTEAALYLSLDEKTVNRWARQGYIPAHPLGQGKRRFWRFYKHEIDAWLSGQTNGALAA